MKTALCQVADTGPLESLAVVMASVGYRCVLPGPRTLDRFRGMGCDTVLSVEHLVRNWGYDEPIDPTTGRPFEVRDDDPPSYCDLYVDVKAHRNGPLVWRHYGLKGRTLWYRINGGEPEHVVRADGFDCGDEVDPPCPVLTPNRWYANFGTAPYAEQPGTLPGEPRVVINQPHPVRKLFREGRAYSFWPPFARAGSYLFPRKGPREGTKWSNPLCLVHNAAGWGYQSLIGPVRDLGVRVHGVGSPDGLIPHAEVGPRLSTALAYVHLKSNDAPGYALYEALYSGCPVVAPRRIVWRCRMGELFEPGVTYLPFDRETHDPLSQDDVLECRREIRAHLDRLADQDENERFGRAGRERLESLVWRADRDGPGFARFMKRNFP